MDSIGPKMCAGLKTKANILVQSLGTFASCKILEGKVGFDSPQDLSYSEASGPYLLPPLCCLLTPVQPSSNTKSLTRNKRKMLMQSMSSGRPKGQGQRLVASFHVAPCLMVDSPVELGRHSRQQQVSNPMERNSCSQGTPYPASKTKTTSRAYSIRRSRRLSS